TPDTYPLSLHDALPILLDGPLEEIQVQAIERLVAAQAGIKPERGDVVTVASMPFDRTLQDQTRRQMQEAAQLEFYYNMAKVGARSEEHTSELQSRENLV